MASLQLLRHATIILEISGTKLLIDPMLSEAGGMPPIPNSPNDRRNPLVELPDTDLEHDVLLVTHLHRDHFDDAAKEQLAGETPTFCQPEDADELAEEGFIDIRPVDGTVGFKGLQMIRTPAKHGHGDLAKRMAPASGFVLKASSEPIVYFTGDTVWYEGVAETLETFDPHFVVLNAGAARFNEGRPITMTAEDVITTCENTDATVVVDHMGAINHCLLTREELRSALAEVGLQRQVVIPQDGERINLDWS